MMLSIFSWLISYLETSHRARKWWIGLKPGFVLVALSEVDQVHNFETVQTGSGLLAFG